MNKFPTKTILVLLAIIIIIVFINWLKKDFLKEGQSYPPELIDFRPTKLDYHSEKPIFYYSEKNLYYDSIGTINLENKPIWTGKVMSTINIFVSPNSQYAAFNAGRDSVIVIDKNGSIKCNITTFNKEMLEDAKETAPFWGQELQWNESSTLLYFMQYRKYVSRRSEKNRSTLFAYSIDKNKISKICDLSEECFEDFYISRNERKVFYRSKKGLFAKLDLSTNNVESKFRWDRWHKLKVPKDSIFINYPANYFENFSQNRRHLVSTGYWRKYESGLYHYDDSIATLIIKGKSGYSAFKGFYYDSFGNGQFLFGNRYYVDRIKSKEYKGTIIVDIIEHKYEFIDKFVYCFFSLTNNDPFDFEKDISEMSFKKKFENTTRIEN